jgi:hypothetical protein
MKYYYLTSILLFAALVGCGHDSKGGDTNNWRPNTRLLDEIAKVHDTFMKDDGTTLARDVKRFYELLRDKKWQETYQLRARAFREDFLESDYLAKAKRAEELWGLLSYEVLSVGFQSSQGSTNNDEAILVCKFTELPNSEVSYSTVFWHKEDGVWKCLSAGPIKLDIFRATRPIIIDWR